MTTVVQPTERLSQLLAQYDELEGQAKAAAERFDAVKDAVKHELRNAAPGETSLVVEHPDLAKPLTLRHSESIGVDVKRMRADARTDHALALMVARYAKKSESWTLARVRGTS